MTKEIINALRNAPARYLIGWGGPEYTDWRRVDDHRAMRATAAHESLLPATGHLKCCDRPCQRLLLHDDELGWLYRVHRPRHFARARGRVK